MVINEILADNDTIQADQDGEFDTWLELYNNGNTNQSLWGFYLSDNANDLTKWRFPDTSIAAHDFLIVWLDDDLEQEGLHAGFSPSAQGGRMVFSSPNLTALDNVQFGAQRSDISCGRFPNGTGNFIAMTPSFAAVNNNGILTPTYEAVINEFLTVNRAAAADQDGEYDAWIELLNNSDEDLSLEGCYLSDDYRNPTRWAFPDTTVAGRAFLIVWADRDSLQTGLHANFELGSRGGSLFLFTPQRAVIDSALYGDQTADVSYGRYPDGEGGFIPMTPSFASPNNNGILTPDCDVVINEFLTLNGTTAADQDGEFDGWVELYNNSGEDFVLQDYCLSDERNLARWAFPDVAIAGQSYMIVWLDSDIQQTGLHANFELNAEGGLLFLLAPNSTVIDSVVYGAQTADISLGRYPNGSGGFIPMTPSFASPNNNGILDAAPDGSTSPDCYLLSPCYPNPFNSSTTIGFQLPLAAEVEVAVYNHQGQRVATLASGLFSAGSYGLIWDGKNQQGLPVNSSVYFYILQAGGHRDARKVLLIK